MPASVPGPVSSPAAAPARRIPYAFARAHGVLPLQDDGEAVLVLARSDASLEGIAELKRVLQRPLKRFSLASDSGLNRRPVSSWRSPGIGLRCSLSLPPSRDRSIP